MLSPFSFDNFFEPHDFHFRSSNLSQFSKKVQQSKNRRRSDLKEVIEECIDEGADPTRINPFRKFEVGQGDDEEKRHSSEERNVAPLEQAVKKGQNLNRNKFNRDDLAIDTTGSVIKKHKKGHYGKHKHHKH